MLLLEVFFIAFAMMLVALVAFVYLAPEAATKLALSAERSRSGLVRREMELSNGLRYAYLEGGQGEALVLLHGFGGNKDNFVRVARLLVKRYRVIIPDIIGFGESSRPSDVDYSPPAQVERLKIFAQELGITEMHLGGNSMGAQIAMIYASLYPAAVKSLWLLSPAGVWSAPHSDVIRIFKTTGENQLIAKNVEQFKHVMTLGMEKIPWIPKPMLNVLARERIENAEFEDRIALQIVDYSVEDQIVGMQTPTLVVFGDKDRVISIQTADVLKKLLENATVKILRGIGHVPMFETPQQCADDYFSFRETLQSLTARKTSNKAN